MDIPFELKVMSKHFFDSETRFASKMWIYLMWFHLQAISKATSNGKASLEKIMNYISKHYTLRFDKPQHLEIFRTMDGEFENKYSRLLSDSSNLTSEKAYKFIAELMSGTEGFQKLDYELRDQNLEQDALQSQAEISYIESKVDFATVKTILEVGAGYGRISEYLLNSNQFNKYVIVDIPPALWLSHFYLEQHYPNIKTSKFSATVTTEIIMERLENFDIIFISPSQLRYLSDNSIDLIIAINCLQEFPQSTINYYFSEFKRLSMYSYIKAQVSPHNIYQDDFMLFDDYLKGKYLEVLSKDQVVFPPNYMQAVLIS